VAAPPELPPELQVKARPPPKKIEHPAEVIYRQKVGDHAFALRVRPGEPVPGQLLELVVDLLKLHDPPDPVVGDREPDKGEDLIVTLTLDGHAHARVLHPLAEPGAYGAHVTVDAPGLYAVRVSRRTGKPGIDATFKLGIGVATPVRPDDVAATIQTRHHGPMRPAGDDADGADGAALSTVMRELGRALVSLDASLASGHGDAAAQARAMAALSKGIAGKVPPFGADRPKEFAQLASGLTAALTELASAPSTAKLQAVQQSQCTKCHAAYRWGVASDVSSWPAFTAIQVPHADSEVK